MSDPTTPEALADQPDEDAGELDAAEEPTQAELPDFPNVDDGPTDASSGSAGSPDADSAPLLADDEPDEPSSGASSRSQAASSGGASGDGEVLGASQPGQASDTVKDPSDWVTGDEPMTGAQRSYLDTLARQAGEQLPADLTKAEASENIDRLQEETGRGSSS